MANSEYHRQYWLKNRDRLKPKMKEYYAQNRDKVRALQKTAYLRRCEKDPTYHERMRERDRASKLRRWRENRAYQKTRWSQQRHEVMVFVGGENGLQCRRCGYDEYPALQVDHVNGGGGDERRQFKDNRKYLEHIKKTPERYQLLCANCNWLKKYEKNENPNKKAPSSSVVQDIH